MQCNAMHELGKSRKEKKNKQAESAAAID